LIAFRKRSRIGGIFAATPPHKLQTKKNVRRIAPSMRRSQPHLLFQHSSTTPANQ
jgi:hypothetical protein